MRKDERKQYIEYLEALFRNLEYEARQIQEEGHAWDTLGFKEKAEACYSRYSGISENVNSIRQILSYFK